MATVPVRTGGWPELRRGELPRAETEGRPWPGRPGGSGPDAAPTFTLAELYHENSKYHRDLMVKERLDQAAALAMPRRSAAGGIALPPPRPDLPCSLAAALRQRRSVRRYEPVPISQETLSDLLFYAAGTTGVRRSEVSGQATTYRVRSYPSAGALYPIDLLAVVQNVEGLNPAAYYYDPDLHGLLPLPVPQAMAAAAVRAHPFHPHMIDMSRVALVIALVAVFPRCTAKYGRRAYRFVVQEAGHVAQNLLLAAVGLGLGAVVIGGFYDDEVNRALGLDGLDESVLSLIPIGVPAADTADPPHGRL